MRSARTAAWARRWARVTLFASLGVLGIAVVRAMRDALPVELPLASADLTPATRQSRADAAAPNIALLVAHDPFSPFRTAPEVPYRIGAVVADSIFMRTAQPVRLLGTIVGGAGRSFAMCRIEGQPARVVYPGERIGGMTLERVFQGSAIFIDEAGARVELRVPRTGE